MVFECVRKAKALMQQNHSGIELFASVMRPLNLLAVRHLKLLCVSSHNSSMAKAIQSRAGLEAGEAILANDAAQRSSVR